MAEFKYVARTPDGQETTGVVNAGSQNDVVQELRRRNLTIMNIQQARPAFGRRMRPGPHPGRPGRAPKPRLKKDDLVVFTRQLSTMISSGIPLLECLEILEEQTADKGFRYVLNNVVEMVRGGSDLSEALGHHPRVFTRIFVNMVRAGEASGQLDIILVRLAEYQESTAALKREIRAAMTYPAISLALITLITIFLMVYIVPQFKQIFDSLGTPDDPIELPFLTNILLSTSVFMRNNFLFLLVGAIGAVVGLIMWRKSTGGRRQFDRMVLKVPIFGPLFRKVAISRFSRTFATLIRSGVPILGSLEIVASTSGNSLIKEAVLRARDNVRQGDTLALPLAASGVFPPMVTKMIAIGEKSGALENLLEKISEFYDQQVSAAVKGLTSMIEPILIGFMGVMVGGIVLAIFMPIFDIQSKLTAGV
ncbi:MAG: type II secretion system F family protein [Planctomycetota bacterium]|nr:MAG: type II secretion system F family protein [Planctomycetota bacterium]